MYKVLWEPRVRETFIVVHETGNEHDRHAMAVYREKDRESSLPLAYTCGVPKVCSNKSLNIEIKLNSLADIRGYLFNFGTGVCKN